MPAWPSHPSGHPPSPSTHLSAHISPPTHSPPLYYPALTLAPTCGADRASWQVFINAGARLLCTSDGVCVIVHVQFSSAGAGMIWGVWFFSSFWDRVWAEWDRKGVFGGEEEGGGVRSGPGAARTILLFHIISAEPSKRPQPRMVRTFLKVYMELGSYFLFLQEQIKDIIIYQSLRQKHGCKIWAKKIHYKT